MIITQTQIRASLLQLNHDVEYANCIRHGVEKEDAQKAAAKVVTQIKAQWERYDQAQQDQPKSRKRR